MGGRHDTRIPPSKIRASLIIAAAWGLPGAIVHVADAATTGIDYHPALSRDSVDTKVEHMHEVVSNGTPLEAFREGQKVYLFWQDGGNVKVQEYGLNDGALTGSSTTVLTHITSPSSSFEAGGIDGASVERCQGIQANNKTLTQVSGARWSAPHIGIAPATVVVSGTGCDNPPSYNGSFADGYFDGSSTYTTDNFLVADSANCTSLTASYKFSNCSLFDPSDSTVPYRCEDPDDSTKTGYCKYFMVYSGNDSASDNKYLLLAHAQGITGPWERYAGDSDTVPDDSDVILYNKSVHGINDCNDNTSFTGVPDLFWDAGDGVHRMWFAGDVCNNPSTMYTETAKDGLDWGLTSTRSFGDDCYGASAVDTTVCDFLAWTGGDPPDNTASNDDPDYTDPGVVAADVEGDTEEELLIFATGADDGCDATAGEGQSAVTLVSVHTDLGDQGTSNWSWHTVTDYDSENGVVLDQRYNCPSEDTGGGRNNIHDPTPVDFASAGSKKFILFFGMGDHKVYVSGSGFACSDLQDNGDADTLADYGADTGCESPTDDSE